MNKVSKKEKTFDMPEQVSGGVSAAARQPNLGLYDMRDDLFPRRLTLAMWDQGFLLRHGPGGAFEDFDRVLSETIERGYNTVRLDPMPQWLDLATPAKVLSWPDPKQPFMPWCWNTAVKGPIGTWLIDFMEKLLSRHELFYTLSAWWFCGEESGPPVRHRPNTHHDAAEMWAEILRQWKTRFGFERLVYIDLANEVPYFLPGFVQRFEKETGSPWQTGRPFTPAQVDWLAAELNGAAALLQREFPELRFTASIHGDLRWLQVPLEFDCLDVHFYSDADARWKSRTQFIELMPQFFQTDSFHERFSSDCAKTHAAIAPMLRARQRAKLAAFAEWGKGQGMPLTTSESWSSWFYFDSPTLNWDWLLDWSEWSVEDAIEFQMWGWTPHNYLQPQFANWKDVKWHQRLTQKFLRS